MDIVKIKPKATLETYTIAPTGKRPKIRFQASTKFLIVGSWAFVCPVINKGRKCWQIKIDGVQELFYAPRD